MKNRIQIIAVAFCVSVLTSHVVAAPAGGAINPKDWAMYCWQRGWKRHPLDKATVKAGPVQMEVKNTTGIHQHALLVYTGGTLKGDFQMIVEFKGGTAFGITDASGRDAHVTAPSAADWRTITMTRRGDKITCSADGKEVKAKVHNGPATMVAMPCIILKTNATASVRRFAVVGADYFAGWPDRLVAGTTLKHSPKLKAAGMTFELVSGPAGMKMDKAGQLTWAPSAVVSGAQQVKVRLTAGGLSFDQSAGIEVVTKEQLAGFKLGLDPKDWQMFCQERRGWKLHPLDKATVKAGPGQLEVKNTTGIGSYAYLVFTRQPKGIAGNFQMAIELKGGRQFGLRRADEHDGTLSIPIAADKWQTITMVRRGRDIGCTADGKKAGYKRWGTHTGVTGFPFVVLKTDEVVTIRRLNVVNRIIDEDYFHKCPAALAEGKALRYRPGFDKPLSGCELASGPKGMTISKDGQLTWTPTAGDVGWHTVKVRLEIDGFQLEQSGLVNVVSKALLAKVGGDVSKIDDLFRRKIAREYHLTPGMGRTLLLLEGDRLTMLGADGLTVVKTVKLPKSYTRIAERKEYYVALATKPQTSIDVVDKQTMKVSRSRAIAGPPPRELVLHPTLPISYVALVHHIRSADRRFVMFYENTGQVREPKGAVGEWLAIDPKGKFLIAGSCRMYESGSRLVVNPQHSFRTPTYGHDDKLVRFALDTDGRPTYAEAKSKPGINGRGIRLSPDATRVAYLSYTGYPGYSKNLAAWTPTDFEIMPTAYATSAGKASTMDFAFHPYLHLAASHTGAGAMFFDSHTGQIQANRLKIPEGGLGDAKIQRLYFSPDGRSVIFQVLREDVRYLRKVELNLTEKERAGIKPPPVARVLITSCAGAGRKAIRDMSVERETS